MGSLADSARPVLVVATEQTMPKEPTTPPTTDALARLVKQKRKLLEQLVTLGRRQGELINASETPTLMRLLTGKQQLIAGLQVVEQGLDAFRHEDPEARQWPTPQDRAACQADADACNALLSEALEYERQCEQGMTERRDALSKQLQQAQSAHAASSAYKPHLRGPRPASPRLQDPAEPLSASLDLTSGG